MRGAFLHYIDMVCSSMTGSTNYTLYGVGGSGLGNVPVGEDDVILRLVIPGISLLVSSEDRGKMVLTTALSATCDWPVKVTYSTAYGTAVTGPSTWPLMAR